jgi:peptidoglycan LD-endopeptidase LytH
VDKFFTYKMSRNKTKQRLLLAIIGFIIVVYLLPFHCVVPVKNAGTKDWNKDSFWYYPWGKSGVHKGIDIFAKEGTDVLAATGGIIIAAGTIEMGGNFVAVLGPKWRVTYYAHLKEIKAKPLRYVKQGEVIGTVGTTGNAAGKPPHLHFSIVSLVPQFGKMDRSTQGWKKLFYLNPTSYF